MSDLSLPPDMDAARREVIEQLEHLIDELERLKAQLDLIPTDVLSVRPYESAPTFKEIYATLARMDEEVYLPALRDGDARTLDLKQPDLDALLHGVDWNAAGMLEIIERGQAARRALVEELRSTPSEAWEVPADQKASQPILLGFAYRIAIQDATLLQTAAYRLHESRLETNDPVHDS